MSETDCSELVELALNQFGDDWHCDNVNFLWIHKHWKETKDKPKPKNWGKQIRKLEQAVRNALTLRSPPPPLASRRAGRSRSPPRSRSPRSPPRSLGSSLGSSSSTEKGNIVARLMLSDAALPKKLDRTAASHVPLKTLDDWIEQLHLAVAESPLCSWPRVMKPADQGIQSLGISTLHYGYRFKFRFKDNRRGELLFHGTSVGSALYILRENFRPRVTITKAPELLRKYGCVPPLVWFSREYSCAAWYPIHGSHFALGEALAEDVDQPVRMIFHVRVESSQRLAKVHRGNNDQHGFSPESVLSIVGLDVIATCFSLHTVNERRFDWPRTRLSDYHNVEFLSAKLHQILGAGQAIACPFLGEPLDPRGLHTKSPEKIAHLANQIQMREMLLQDQRELVAFHESIVRAEHEAEHEWNAETMGQLVQGASQRVRRLLAKAEGSTEAALDTVSSQLNSEDFADIPSQTRQSKKQLKKYRRKLRLAKADHYTDKCEVYEAACPDPILAPEITEPAGSST